MSSQPNTTVCGLPPWVAFPANDSTSYINDVVSVAVNIPLSVFAFLSNLAVIVTVIKTPQLQRPSNILLCGLAATDCLQGLTSQPLFFIWRWMLHRARRSCDFQTELFQSRYVFNTLTSGWSFLALTLISFDRAHALAKPLVYRIEATNKVAFKSTITTGIVWLLLTILIHFVIPDRPSYILMLTSSVLFIILPIVNHIRMFVSIRSHNSQVADAVQGKQLSVLFRREKKVALDMLIVVIVLLACLGPMLVLKVVFQSFFPELYDLLYPWAFTLLYLNSSINPILYVTRNEELRNAFKAVTPCCVKAEEGSRIGKEMTDGESVVL